MFGGTYTIIEIVQFFIGLFLGIGFVQSGLDKMVDRKGNLAFLTDHFSEMFLSPFVIPMLFVITVLETLGGFLCLGGVAMGLIYNEFSLLLWGLVLIAINLTALFFGQRFAKDYEGAGVLVNYFILTIIGILTFHI
ncbi:MAG: DoxX family protein [Candidatus Marinimicrobia bacterium]|nr:DoxX family protein [Candidatus Neomarinimicrobiota bacterium]